jgi:A/G-specific adenine glycosylase
MPDKLPEFSRPLLKWYRQNSRDLPWRRHADPYRVWLSEIILQQTRVDQGLPYYRRFIDAYPDVHALARASEEEILKLWQGLGYYSRARNLHATARHVANELDGVFPGSHAELVKLKGIGPYTAAAIASICFNEPRAVVDGNVFRVLARVFGVEADIASGTGKKEFSQLADELIDSRQPGDYNQAIMEFGATHCKPARPNCSDCFLAARCVALKEDKVKTLPVKSKKTRVRKRYFDYLVTLDEEYRTLLTKRNSGDIWEGLYDFPMVEGSRPLTKAKLLNSTTFLELPEAGR